MIVSKVKTQQPQKVSTFKVVDAKTNATIPFATVVISRAKLAIATEKDGVFHIPGNIAAMRDTIAFYAQNYTPLKLPLNKLANISTIGLTGITFLPKTVQSKFLDKQILNDYPVEDIGLYAGVPSEDAPFDYMQIAQRMTVKSPDCRLANITIHKP